ncbi:MAG: beta-galactosidase [Clostridiales bacterium]|nr:beta-galactosidase [Clostridiales bacterium]
MESLYHCAAYYPELWPESDIENDIFYMKKAGINLVRMGEFAWHFMEPSKDEIDVSFFVRVVDRLYKNGIKTIMCTPTPTPPIWLTHNHPERLVKDQSGNLYIHGARQHGCTNNPYLRKRGLIITEAMAKAFQGNPAVIAWQLDNELKALVGECVCDECRQKWHQWLKNKYGTIEALNEAWGTEIWSEAYQSFEQVVQPLTPPIVHNSSLMTNYRQFSRETVNEFAYEQAQILRKYNSAPITHDVHTNFALDTEALFNKLDFTSMNGYTLDDGYCKWLFDYDLYRSMRQDNRFFVTETSPCYAGNLLAVSRPHRDGFLEAEALGAYANGAFGFSYWLFRQQRSGCEQTHGSLLSAWGDPTEGYDQVCKVNAMREKIEPYFTQSSHVPSQIAMTYSEQARLFFFTEPLLEDGGYFKRMLELHNCLEECGLPRDLTGEHADLSGYKLLLTPLLPYVSPDYLQRAEAFVRNGGVWLVGPMTGYRTQHHTVHTDSCHSALETLAGIKVKYFYPFSDTGVTGSFGDCSAPLRFHGCALESRGAQIKGLLSSGMTPGLGYVSEHQVGKGRIVMIGAMPDLRLAEGRSLWMHILKHYADTANITNRFTASAGTTVIRRNGKYEIVTAINGSDRNGSYELDCSGIELFSGKYVNKGQRTLAPFSYEVVIRQDK